MIVSVGETDRPSDRPTCAHVFVYLLPTGFGVGAHDVFHLLSTSLQPDLAPASVRMSSIEHDMLRFYHTELGKAGVDIHKEFTWATLLKQYDLALLDFVRYVIGTGQVFDEDWWYVERASRLL
jgi:hypothetical protein